MNLSFERMAIKNFRSYIGQHNFEFGGSGLYFLRGRNSLEPRLEANDAGKSTLFDALCWGLYGTTVQDLNSPDIRPWAKPDASPCVTVIFKIDGDVHEIAREANPNKLKLNNRTCGQSDITHMLQMSRDVFLQTILYGQRKRLFFDLPPREALDLLTEVLDLNRWDKRSSYAAERVKALEQKLIAYQGQLEGVERLYNETKNNMASAKAKADVFSQEREASIVQWMEELEKSKKYLDAQTNLKGEADLIYDGASTEIKALKNEIEQLLSQHEVARTKRDKASAKVAIAKADKRRLELELEGLGETDECPTCGQTVTDTDFDRHRKEIRKQIKELSANKMPEHLDKEMEVFERAIDLAKTMEKEFQDKADKALSAKNRLTILTANIGATVKGLLEKIENKEKERNVYYEHYDKLKKDCRKIKDELDVLKEEADRTSRILERTKPWVKGFKEIRLLIVDEVLQELEFVTNSMLPEAGLDGWTVNYGIEKETKSGTLQRGLNIIILSPRNKEAVKWRVWGGGVGQRLRIVGALALSEVLLNHAGVSCNLEILDEQALGMTRGGVRDLCEYLAQRAVDNGKSIWLIDHLSVTSDKFAKVITVVKDRNGSRIEVE